MVNFLITFLEIVHFNYMYILDGNKLVFPRKLLMKYIFAIVIEILFVKFTEIEVDWRRIAYFSGRYSSDKQTHSDCSKCLR